MIIGSKTPYIITNWEPYFLVYFQITLVSQRHSSVLVEKHAHFMLMRSPSAHACATQDAPVWLQLLHGLPFDQMEPSRSMQTRSGRKPNGQFQVTVFSRFCYVLLCNHEYIHCLNHRQTKDYITRRNETERKLYFERRQCVLQTWNGIFPTSKLSFTPDFMNELMTDWWRIASSGGYFGPFKLTLNHQGPYNSKMNRY